MNWVKENRENLNKSNYVLKADSSSNYWFGVSEKKLNEYKSLFNFDFNIILFGSESDEGDFYVIPYLAIKDLFVESSLYNFQNKRKRWVGDIRNHKLRIRKSDVERNISDFFSLPSNRITKNILKDDDLNDYAIENSRKEVSIRIKQSKFRRIVLDNFNSKCCLSSITESQLLVASHIIPWSSKIETRLSPHNGLCFSILYDKLFDKGFFTITESKEVLITSRINELSSETRKWLNGISGKKISKPRNYEISIDALKYHKEKIFESF